MNTATKPGRVIVTTDACDCGSLRVLRAHHHDLPEIQAEGETNQAAATNLILLLERTLDSPLERWQREAIEGAINDVKLFITQGS